MQIGSYWGAFVKNAQTGGGEKDFKNRRRRRRRGGRGRVAALVGF